MGINEPDIENPLRTKGYSEINKEVMSMLNDIKK